MKKLQSIGLALLASFILFSCNNSSGDKTVETKSPKLKQEAVSYTTDSVTMNSYVVYDENIEGKRPAVVVVPEWWGLNDYAKRRANELAELGYIAIAVDMYGNGQTADNPEMATKLSTPFYANPVMAKAHFDAALNKLKSYPQTDTANIGAMGYCFGGGMVLDVARMGEDLKYLFYMGLMISLFLKQKLMLLKSKWTLLALVMDIPVIPVLHMHLQIPMLQPWVKNLNYQLLIMQQQILPPGKK